MPIKENENTSRSLHNSRMLEKLNLPNEGALAAVEPQIESCCSSKSSNYGNFASRLTNCFSKAASSLKLHRADAEAMACFPDSSDKYAEPETDNIKVKELHSMEGGSRTSFASKSACNDMGTSAVKFVSRGTVPDLHKTASCTVACDNFPGMQSTEPSERKDKRTKFYHNESLQGLAPDHPVRPSQSTTKVGQNRLFFLPNIEGTSGEHLESFLEEKFNPFKAVSFQNSKATTHEKFGQRENEKNYCDEQMLVECKALTPAVDGLNPVFPMKTVHKPVEISCESTMPSASLEGATQALDCKTSYRGYTWKPMLTQRKHEAIHTKVLSVSGLSQFSIQRSLDEKVTSEARQLNEQPPKLVLPMECRKQCSSWTNPQVSKPDTQDTINTNHALMKTSISLREWLGNPSRLIDMVESLHIFKQILEIVDEAHSQGRVLGKLRPSSFALSSLHRVIFVESPASQLNPKCSGNTNADSYYSFDYHLTKMQQNKKRSRHSGTAGETFQSNSPSDRSCFLGNHSFEGVLASLNQAPEYSLSTPSSSNLNVIASEDRNMHSRNMEKSMLGLKDQKPFVNQIGKRTEQSSADSDYNLAKDLLTEEENWYISPEELNGESNSVASDVYSLGVLLFELFCPVSSLEEQKRVMINFRQRILPAYFLSEHPKEAGFCLWLLHPDPSSRPKVSEILHSELMTEVHDALAEREMAANIDVEDAEAELLLDFLLRLQKQKQEKATKLSCDVSCFTSDIEEVEKRQSNLMFKRSVNAMHNRPEIPYPAKLSEDILNKKTVIFPEIKLTANKKNSSEETTSSTLQLDETVNRSNALAAKGAKLMKNFNHLEQVYFAVRGQINTFRLSSGDSQGFMRKIDKDCVGNNLSSASDKSIGNRSDNEDPLGCFFDSICKYARYSRFDVKATLRHGDLLNSANVICSVGFDRDQEFFAVAGVSKKIKVFSCEAVLNENVDIHYPAVEISSTAKLSSVCWNNYIKSYIASTDYDGFVQIWDASIGQRLAHYTEHRKRAWSVDFSQVDPTKLASGSDDCTVKLWSIKQERSIDTLKTVANVCCVQFPPDSAYQIVFGSADYKIYCYDLRKTKLPWCTLAGHKKAVSYVKFIDSSTIISASTDSTLKMWDLAKATSPEGSSDACTLSFSGHTNEKNFVGLTVADGYIACGSETNSVFAYYKSLPMPMLSHRFGCVDPITGRDTDDDNGQFVSSVCWRGNSKLLVAANSTGNIKLLEMV